MTMNNKEFSIIFDGDALDDHQMDVRDFAPALLSVGKLFEEANRVINHDATTINIKVKATYPGSFGIDLGAIQELASQINALTSGVTLADAANLVAVIFGGGGSIVGIIQWLKGRKIKNIEKHDKGVTLETEDGKLDISTQALELLQNAAIREALKDIVKPLSKTGIESFSVKEGKKEVISVSKKERKYFDVPELTEEDLLDDNIKCAYVVQAPDFEEGNKWRVHDGSSSLWVAFEDEDFVYKVQNKQMSFTKGDTLICDVHMRQFKSKKGELQTEYTIKKVLDRKSAAKQLKLTD